MIFFLSLSKAGHYLPYNSVGGG